VEEFLKMKRIIPALLFSVASFLGCHWFDNVDDLHDCALNSQFPCPCTTSCQNGQTCVQKQGNHGSYGQCTLPCNGIDEICQLASAGYGIDGAGGQCIESGYCAIGCLFNEDCPPGMICAVEVNGGAPVCVPGGELDEGVFRPDSGTSATDTDSESESQPGDTGTSDSDGVDSDGPSLTQRQTDCLGYIDAAFSCNPNQDQTQSELLDMCVQNNWYAIDDCYSCVINAQCPAFAPGGANCTSVSTAETCCQNWVNCYLRCEACKTE
jgi:hypothetical protein